MPRLRTRRFALMCGSVSLTLLVGLPTAQAVPAALSVELRGVRRSSRTRLSAWTAAPCRWRCRSRRSQRSRRARRP